MKILAKFILISLTASIIVGHDISIILSDKKLNSETLIIAAQEIPPYFYTKKNGEIKGLFYDIANDVCIQEKIRCDFFTLPFRRALTYIESGKIHITLPMGVLNSRKKIMDFSSEVLTTGYVLFGEKNAIDKIVDLEKVKGEIGVHSKSSTEKKLNKLISDKNLQLEVVRETDVNTVFSRLEKHRYDYIFVNKDIASNWQKQDKSRLINFKSYDKYLSPVKYHVAYTKQVKDMRTHEELEKFKKGLSKYLKSDEFANLLKNN